MYVTVKQLMWQPARFARHNRVDQAENRGVGTDAQGKREDRNSGEAGRFSQHPEPQTDVLQERLHGHPETESIQRNQTDLDGIIDEKAKRMA